MFEPTYTKEQWMWILERKREGYTLKELAKFLDMNIATVSYNVNKIKKPLPDLEKRKKEFNRIRTHPDEIHLVSRYVPQKKLTRY